MIRSFFDILKDFSDDLDLQVGLPLVEMRNPPLDSASMKFRLNNKKTTPRGLDSAYSELTGEINVQISNTLGASDFEMESLASDVISIYKRTKKLGSTTIQNSVSSSVYSSKAHSHINVIISFVDVTM